MIGQFQLSACFPLLINYPSVRICSACLGSLLDLRKYGLGSPQGDQPIQMFKADEYFSGFRDHTELVGRSLINSKPSEISEFY